MITAQVANPGSSVATAALYAPTNLAASPSGHDVSLSWSAGTNGSGYSVEGAANGLSANCTGLLLGAVGTSAQTSYTDAGRYSPQGTYFCYRVTTTYGTSWRSQQSNPVAAAQIGFVTTSVTLGNGGLAGTLGSGDSVVVRFNQPVDPASGPTSSHTVCASTLGAILLGSTTTSGACSGAETVTVGKLTGISVSVAARWSATYAWSNGNRTLTVTLGSRTNGLLNPLVTGPWTYAPTTSADKSLSATGAFHVCDSNVGGGNCLPVPTGGF